MRINAWLSAFLMLLVVADFAGAAGGAAQGSVPPVFLLSASGPLTPLMAEYLARGIAAAEEQGAQALIFELNTPGGSLDIMNRMQTDILASNVPVIVYVAPNGAMAGSAGTIITLSGHAAAMAPETAIGAASPVGGAGEDLSTTEQAKTKNIMKATVRSLAERRGPEAVQVAESTIESAQAVSASEALRIGLVDFIAQDEQDLLRQMNGFQVTVNNQPRTFQTAGAPLERFAPTIIEQVLGALTNPNIVLLLLNIGVVAILIEMSTPGGWVAGFTGVVCLALAVYGLGIIPVNWFGIIFLLLAFALFILDIKAPTHGALTAAGVGSLIVGGLVLFNSRSMPGFPPVSVPLVVSSGLITGAMFFGILLFAIRAQKEPVRMGVESLVGRSGTVSVELNPRGQVHIGGESWTAELEGESGPIPRGERVLVVGVKGLRLQVKRQSG